MNRAPQVNDRDKTAARLLGSAARNTYDPGVDIDWAAPLEADKPFLPLHRSSLYGTELWEQLSEQQRLELSKHELISVATSGIWFEALLMKILLNEFYNSDPTTAHAQYALTEIADECRHSTMFAKMANWAGVPHYGPVPWLREVAKLLPVLVSGPSAYASVLVAEEILDRLQRDQMNDENVQPLVRMVNRIHVLEEARHVTFAREEVARGMAECRNPVLRARHQYMTALVGFVIVYSLINPRVYRCVGLDPKQAHRTAWRNRNYQETMRWNGEKIMSFLDEVGLLGGPGMYWWRKAHLIR